MGGLRAAWSAISGGVGFLKNTVIGVGGLLVGWGAVGGPNSLPQNLLKNIFTLQETAGAEAGVAGSFQGIYKIAEMLASLLESIGINADGLDRWAKERLNAVPSGENGANPVAEFASDNAGALITGAGAALGLGIGGNVIASALKGGGTPPAAGLVVPANGGGVGIPNVSAAPAAAANPGLWSRMSGFMSKIPVIGKYLAVGAVAVGTGAALLGPDEANASDASPEVIATEDHSMAAGLAGTGASFLLAAPAANALAVPMASLGLKAIPGIASVAIAAEGIWDTVGYALDGQWAQAGTRLVAGVGETVAGLGGILTYGTVGTAWREAVRAGGAAVFGEENAITHSPVVNIGSWLVNQFTGAHDNTSAPAPAERTPTLNPAYVPAFN